MTLPLVLCLNRLTGGFITVPNKAAFDTSLLDYMQCRLLDEENGYKEFKYLSNKVAVLSTENYRYCGLLTENILDQSGKRRTWDYSRTDFERYCASLEAFAEESTREYVSFAHDVRYVIGTLVHKSVVNDRNKNNIKILIENLGTINSVSSILSAKDAFFRFQTNSFSGNKIDIDVTGKFFKISKSVPHLTINREKRITFDFKSDGSPKVNTYDIFDFIPYLLLENVVKYAPTGTDASIEISKVAGKASVEIESFGPRLLDGEQVLIFERGYRGKNAIATGVRGEGMGLFHVSQALKKLDLGSISVVQYATDYPMRFDGVEYVRTVFRLSLKSK